MKPSILFLIGLLPINVYAEPSAQLNAFSDDDQQIVNISCNGIDVQFARGMRWTPPDLSPELSIGGIKKPIYLEKGCYSTISCEHYKAKLSVAIARSPACGGNAVSEDFIIIDLKSGKKKIIDYEEANASNIARE